MDPVQGFSRDGHGPSGARVPVEGAGAPLLPPPPLEGGVVLPPPPLLPEPLSRLLQQDLEEPPEPTEPLDPPRERLLDLGAGGQEAMGAEATRVVEGMETQLAVVISSRRRSF